MIPDQPTVLILPLGGNSTGVSVYIVTWVVSIMSYYRHHFKHSRTCGSITNYKVQICTVFESLSDSVKSLRVSVSEVELSEGPV